MRKKFNRKYDRRHNIVYQITNKINNKTYIGCHQTDNLNDKYMGSGTILRRAFDKYGIENFTRVILENFNTAEKMIEREGELVNEEFIKRKDTYNIIEGGKTGGGLYTATVRDKTGKCFRVLMDDPRYVSGELVGATKGTSVVRDKNGNRFAVSKNDPRLISGELVGTTKGLILVKDIFGNYSLIDREEFRRNKNKYKLGGIWLGRKHKEESKRKIGKANSIHQMGEKNNQYGTCWIYKDENNKKIKKEELKKWLGKGWLKGRLVQPKTDPELLKYRINEFIKIYPKRGWSVELGKKWGITSSNASKFCHNHFPEYFTDAA